MFEKANDILKTELDKRLKDANLDWERTALNMGWDPETIKKVQIINGDEGYTLDYSEEDKDEVFALEYGDGKSPKAAMRIFSRDHGPLEKLAQDAIKAAIHKTFFGAGSL